VWWAILAKAQFCGNAFLQNYYHEQAHSGPLKGPGDGPSLLSTHDKKTSAKYFKKM
jgi:hypothetical protein